jgi:multidrug efflux system outer membrane protein
LKELKQNKMTRIKNSATFILMLVVLAACNVSKDIEKPAAELPTNFRNAATEDKSSIADIQWKRFFTDISLQKTD